jgi:hypothetical protein
MQDRIVLHLGTDSPTLRQAVEEHRAYIAAETLTTEWSPTPLNGEAVHRATAKVDGQDLVIELRKV